MKKIIHYKNISYVSINVYPDGTVSNNYQWVMRDMAHKGKVLYIDTENNYDVNNRTIKFDIEAACVKSVTPLNAEKLFISPQSKIPRDVIRNSGYKIVLDPDRADVTVIPVLKRDEEFMVEQYCAVLFDGTTAHLVEINKRNWPNSSGFLTLHVNAITKYFHDTYGEEIEINAGPNYDKINVCFVPRCQDYEDILLEKFPYRKYIPDNRVSLIPSVEINIDTLLTWKMCRDRELVEKAVINSDYQNYPLTIGAFLCAEREDVERNSSNAQFRRILNLIEYDNIRNSYRPLSYDVSPKDFAMLQSWILYRLGLPETGGWVDPQLFHQLPSIYENFMKTRIACAPTKLNADCNIELLRRQIQNFNKGL